MGYRDYDPMTARFTATDPLGYAGGEDDLYGYCCDDPVNFHDPTGMFIFGGAATIPLLMAATRAAPMVARAARTYGPKALRAIRAYGKQAGKAVEQAGKYVTRKAPEVWDKAQKSSEKLYHQARAELPHLADKTSKAEAVAKRSAGKAVEAGKRLHDGAMARGLPHHEKMNVGAQVADGIFGGSGPGSKSVGQMVGAAKDVFEHGKDYWELMTDEPESEQKKTEVQHQSGGFRGR